VRIARDLLEQIVEHAKRDAPDECCGVVSARDGAATGVYPLENVAHSPLRFDTGPDLVKAYLEIEDRGEEIGAIYHSHTRTPPYPSQTDVNFSRNWPGVEWIIVGIDGDAEPLTKSYLIDPDGRIEEVQLD
jgi:[CysO sulfur-carrier protein]-S-L-cysteine hydrolase